MADDELVFRPAAFSVVNSWLVGGVKGDADRTESAAELNNERALEANAQQARRHVQLYRASTANDKPSLSGRRFNGGNSDSALTEEQRELKRKLLRRPGGGAGSAYRSTAERVAASAKQAAEETEKALDREEEELVRYKKGDTSAERAPSGGSDVDAIAVSAGGSKKRKLTAQEELLEKLREDAARKKAKNLKAKLRQQRKRQRQQHE